MFIKTLQRYNLQNAAGHITLFAGLFTGLITGGLKFDT
jgi:hypothetical protein